MEWKCKRVYTKLKYFSFKCLAGEQKAVHQREDEIQTIEKKFKKLV